MALLSSIDSTPIFNTCCVNALAASDYLIIPVTPSKKAAERVPLHEVGQRALDQRFAVVAGVGEDGFVLDDIEIVYPKLIAVTNELDSFESAASDIGVAP